MSPIKIGFEYEGYNPEGYVSTTGVMAKLKNTLDLIYVSKEDGINFMDGYSYLAELRFNPDEYPPGSPLFGGYYDFISEFGKIEKISFKETIVPEREHKQSLEMLDKSAERTEDRFLRSKRDFVGEHINYDFKQVMTVKDNKVDVMELEPQDRNRGGGLHINISPIDPKKVKDFIVELDSRLRPLQNDTFKSKYRTNLMFRYRDYNNTNGVEYMSMGVNFCKIKGRDEFISLFEEIVKIVKQVHAKH